jgi:hypothetical protein
LLDHDYPDAAGLSRSGFVALVEPLEDVLDAVPDSSADDALPFAIVVSSALVPTAYVMDQVVDGKGKPGLVDMTPVQPSDFVTVDAVDVPDAPVYLLVDVDTGSETLNVRPGDALGVITERGRTPLTIDEGVGVLTHFPHVLRTHNAFQLLASRRDDKRIPSIWTSYQRPRLGWCWEGNPHSWLGSASAAARMAASD